MKVQNKGTPNKQPQGDNVTANKFACALPPCLKPGASTARGVW
ncbi:hypothetical protein [Nostoc sp. UHCC 0870]